MTARGSERARTFGLLAMSLAAHVVVFSVLGLVPPPSEVLAMDDIEMEVYEPEEPELEPEPPEPEPPEPEPEPEPEPKPAPRAAAPEPEPEPEPQEAPPEEEIADFTGVTLTADGEGAGWSSVVGSGAPLRGPVGKIKASEAKPQQAAKAAPVGPRFVPVGSLARKPQAPSGLEAILEKHFPRRARLQGIEGKGVLHLRLLPNGRFAQVKVLEDSPAGFGFASSCIDALRAAPPFSPAFDGSGSAVSTDIKFKCDFVVGDY